ncbi:PAAR domain-containing protein [Paraliomyxa miuraensis]|uniref:PAAR domain-containing protein n=1 Tax=Paraliomyxa miuraensis TaxID=376150 RepID=UPI00224FDBFD|nr:PAAR domain-containing protein [Paraliomyxa miuraensis]MCX4239737.1 PAAR domain-containing protein [Paraliomyxa miuraensis]
MSGAWDELTAFVLRVGLPRAFRPRAARRRGQPHVVEWLDEAQVEPLWVVLEPVVSDALERHGGHAKAGAARDVPEMGERATFERLGDYAEHPEQLLEVDVDDAVWSFDADDGRFEQWGKIVLVPAAGFAARVGDVLLHGEPIAPGPGSPNVLIGGRPALRTCDSHVSTRTEPTSHAGGGFVTTYTKVEINGFPALRVGDSTDGGPHGLDAIAVGCATVVIGPRPQPVTCWRAREVEAGGRPGAYPFRWRREQSRQAERKQVLGVELDGPRTWTEGTARAVRLWAEARPEDERR